MAAKFYFKDEKRKKVLQKKNQLLHLQAQKSRGVAQPGSVLVWGARGRKFKSCHPDLIFKVLQRC